jgi:WD40 repeat protein
MIQISPDLLASSSQDATVRIWNLTTNVCKFLLREHVDAVFGLKLVTSDLLASGSWDKAIKLWNITSGELERTLVGHTNLMLWSVDLMPSDDSHTQSVMIASGSWDRKIKLWNWQTGECLNTSNTGMQIRTLAVLDPTISTQTSSKKKLSLNLNSKKNISKIELVFLKLHVL